MEDSLTYTTQRLRDMFEEAERVTYNARLEAERARDYFDGRQWTAAEEAELKRRGQPALVFNRIRRKIQWLRGLEIKQRTDPKAFPRTPQDVGAAEAATDALRYVADNVSWDRVKSAVFADMLVEGFGGCEILHQQTKRGDVEIIVRRYPWDRLFYDPYSREHDFSDARYLGAVVWQDRAELLEEYPDQRAQIEQMAEEAIGVETYDDRPRHGLWYDAHRHRVRVVLTWYKRGEVWHWCKHTDRVKLDEGESPYTDEDGESVCPLVMQSLYVGRDNDRYGVVRDMFAPQDEVNKRRSKALHLLNTRQTRVSPALTNQAEIRRELTKSDGMVVADADEFEIIPTGDLASGHVSLLQEAKQEIDLMGANSALEGETGESTSGRAVLARQQGGMVEIAPEMDELAHFTQRCFEAMWNRVQQFWTAEKWVRVTDDEKNVRFVGLNRPVTFGEMLGQQPPEVVQQAAMQMRLMPNDPRLSAVVEIENNVAELAVDIILEEAPDRISLMGETFEALAKYGPALPPEVLIEADPTLPQAKKEKLLELLQQAQAAQQQNPMNEIAMAQGAAKVDETRAKTMKLAAEAQQLPIARAISANIQP